MKVISLVLSGCLLTGGILSAQYPTPDETGKRIQDLGSHQNMSVSVLTRTVGGNDIFVITAGEGKTEEKPAVAVIGGVTGTARYSVEMVLRMAEKLAASKAGLMNNVTFYFFPDMAPDAGAGYFSSPRCERLENDTPVDDDRDGKTDEDGYDDLNHDGMITWMRIRDTIAGEWIIHPGNPDIMIKADPSKNEKGQYILMREGFDNDHDGEINEDSDGGVIFNKNFSFNYPGFTHGSGINTMSENETRALAKFLFDHWNIFAVLAIGPDNNLTGYNDLKADLIDKSIPSAVSSPDKPYFEKVVRIYNEAVNLPEKTVSPPSGGNLLSWAYFDYNRFAFSTPAWSVPKAKDDRGSAEYDYLEWKGSSDDSNDLVKWEPVDHPDMKGKTVEVGGLKPFVVSNPPVSAMDSLADMHFNFLTSLAALHPALTIRVDKVITRGDDIFQVEAEITNSGGLPTMTQLAENSRWVKKIRVEMKTGSGNELSGGQRVFLFDRLDPGETKKLIWIVEGRGKVTLSAGSPQTGFSDRIIELN